MRQKCTSQGIGRQGTVLKHRNSSQKSLLPCGHMPLLVYVALKTLTHGTAQYSLSLSLSRTARMKMAEWRSAETQEYTCVYIYIYIYIER